MRLFPWRPQVQDLSGHHITSFYTYSSSDKLKQIGTDAWLLGCHHCLYCSPEHGKGWIANPSSLTWGILFQCKGLPLLVQSVLRLIPYICVCSIPLTSLLIHANEYVLTELCVCSSEQTKSRCNEQEFTWVFLGFLIKTDHPSGTLSPYLKILFPSLLLFVARKSLNFSPCCCFLWITLELCLVPREELLYLMPRWIFPKDWRNSCVSPIYFFLSSDFWALRGKIWKQGSICA